MRIAITAVAVTVVGLLAAGVLGVAGAETTPSPTAPAPRTVGVQGVATVPIASEASAEVANATYRQAMAAAISDGQGKAQFLAEKVAGTLGPAQSVGEGGGYIQCPGEVEYIGAQPDFGSGAPVIEAASSVSLRSRAVAAPPHRPAVKRRKRHAAKKSAAQTCTLSTQVALVYQLS
jgi:hypothetical protein